MNSGTYPTVIYGPKSGGTYLVEFHTAEGEALAIFGAGERSRSAEMFPGACPYGLVVPDVEA